MDEGDKNGSLRPDAGHFEHDEKDRDGKRRGRDERRDRLDDALERGLERGNNALAGSVRQTNFAVSA